MAGRRLGNHGICRIQRVPFRYPPTQEFQKQINRQRKSRILVSLWSVTHDYMGNLHFSCITPLPSHHGMHPHCGFEIGHLFNKGLAILAVLSPPQHGVLRGHTQIKPLMLIVIHRYLNNIIGKKILRFLEFRDVSGLYSAIFIPVSN